MRSKHSPWFYGICLITIAADQFTKLIARRALEDGAPVKIIPGLLDLRLSYNSGAAFGVMPNYAPLFVIVALVAIFAIFRLKKAGEGARSLSIGLGMLLGGAVGNLIDRIATPTREVTDFISVYIRYAGENRYWPTFNVADIGIVGGAFLVFVYVYVISKRMEPADVE